MKALFITTQTADCANHVRAWNSFNETAEHLAFDHMGIRNDWQYLDVAEKVRPEVIFYIGAYKAPGNPRIDTLASLRKVAPVINVCSDAMDKPWHSVLEHYRKHDSFDLQVSIDGASESPVDFATLTPVDPEPFLVDVLRDIRCGFSGSIGKWTARSEIVKALVWFGGLTSRERGPAESYDDHARFMRRSQLILNISYTGSGHAHHIKGRVLEAGWAGCALLEPEGSPIAEWFPEGSYFTYRDPVEAANLIKELSRKDIEASAALLAAHVRTHYQPAMIYGAMLERIGLTT